MPTALTIGVSSTKTITDASSNHNVTADRSLYRWRWWREYSRFSAWRRREEAIPSLASLCLD
jgi:hypothetical protein